MTRSYRVRGVSVLNGRGARLVDRVSLKVAAGEFLGVVGETGAGKTLAMRAVLGLLPAGLAAEGTIDLGAGDVTAGDVRRLRGYLGIETAMVLQNPVAMLDPMLRVRAQLVEGVVRRGVLEQRQAVERSHELLARMGFSDPVATGRLYPHQLSGGMAQRVVTALAMMPHPKLLVLDEPTSALDANVRVEVLRLIREVATDEHMAVIMVSHDLGLVSHFCDQITVMYAGRVVESGRAAKVVAQPAHPYTAALLACAATLVAELRVPLTAVGGLPPDPAHRPPGCAFSPRCPRAKRRCVESGPGLEPHGRQLAACHFPLNEAA